MPVTTFAQTSTEASENLDHSVTDWNICNETSFILRVAVASHIANVMIPRGWLHINPGACTAVKADLNSPRYVFAQSRKIHIGGIREWKGETEFCVDETDFIADANIDCALQNLNVRNFFQVDPKEKITTLIEPENYGRKAAIAGIQRLLQDNGYPVAKIDSIMGRNTLATLRTFLKSVGKPLNTPRQDILDSLAEVALKNQPLWGLTTCNKSSFKVWLAIAYSSKTIWKSKGWWALEPETCSLIHPESLKDKNMHIYALQEQPSLDEKTKAPDKPLRTGTALTQSFCISEARFYARGQDYCANRGYRSAKFKALSSENEDINKGINLDLTDSDFDPAQSSTPLQLRR